jgi:DNA invertase Pin-like site-specific DNA recombinase
MTNYITYLRVSTDAQKQSGLGIEAQRALVMSHIKQHTGELTAEFIDYESGRKTSAISRPNLHTALQLVEHTPNSKLLLAKTDRIARDLHFISGLLKRDVPLIVAGQENMTKLEWHMHAMIAEHEADMISQRTKQALAEAKKRGVILGAPRDQIAEISAKGGASTHRKAMDYRKSVAPLILQCMNDARLRRTTNQKMPDLFKIADRLNSLGIKTANGRDFKNDHVRRIITAENLYNEYNK